MLSWDYKNALNYQRKIADSMKGKSDLDKIFDKFKESNDKLEIKKRDMVRAEENFRIGQ